MKGFRHVHLRHLHLHPRPPWMVSAVGVLVSGTVLLGGAAAIAQSGFRLNLPDVPDLSAPGNRESGSTREASCIEDEEQVIVLTPENNYGQTQAAYPTFYVYIPPSTAKFATFRMVNATTRETFYEEKYRIVGDSGIAGITLPDNGLQQPLEVGQSYYWYFGLICDETPTDGTTVESMVTRVPTVVAAAGAETAALPGVYAEAGLWYDALAASADLKQADNDTAWDTLLRAVGLDTLIPVPFLAEALTPENAAMVVTP